MSAEQRTKDGEVGCEGNDGLLRIHPESETCDVCTDFPTSNPRPYLAKPILEWLRERVNNSLSGIKYGEAFAEIERLRAALERYGRHWNDCPSIESIDAACTCGYREFCPLCKAERPAVETPQTPSKTVTEIAWRIVNSARDTGAAANCVLVHRQLVGELREALQSPSETSASLLRAPSAHAPPGCHCQERCMAPVIQGRQTACRDPEKAARFAVKAGASHD
jgi:hypothetical protein